MTCKRIYFFISRVYLQWHIVKITLLGVLFPVAFLMSENTYSQEFDLYESTNQGIMMPVTFSHKSGFYSNPFELKISHEDTMAVIRYTTDGSVPDENSAIFDYSLAIYDKSEEGPEISLIPTSPNWKTPQEGLPRAMIVNARAFREGFLPGPVKCAVFFINDSQSFLHDIAVISLITAGENLFDDDIGIYVEGNSSGGNYNQRGEEWERPAWLELFDETGKPEYSGGIGIRIHGGTSRRFPQKSLRLYFRSQYGNSWLHHELFPGHTVQSFKRLILRQSGHDMWQTMLRDGFMQSLLEHTHQDRQAYRPAVLYLNGEYWGIHNIRERYDKYYLQTHHNVDPENLDMLAYTSLQIGEGDRQHYQNMIQYIQDNGLEQDEHFSHLKTLMDVESYTDFKIAEIFFYRWDIGNIRHWRERTPEGKWYWMQFDLDTGYGGFWSLDEPWSFNMLEYVTEPDGAWEGNLGHNHNSPTATFLLRKLFENENYRIQFITRFADLLNTNFSSSEAFGKIDKMSTYIRDEIPLQIARWKEIPSKEQWENEIEYMRDFARLRPDIQRNHIYEYFDLESVYDLKLDVSNQLAGHIRVNTIHVRPETPGVSQYPWPWSGKYFGGVPVTLEAIPAPGYRFSHWEGLTGETEKIITLNLSTETFIKAVFERIDEPVLLHYWLFNDNLPNDTPLEEIASIYFAHEPSHLQYNSCLEGYPFHPFHPYWRRASMERRNNPTPLNYRPEGNNGISYANSHMRGIQIKQPFRKDDRENSLIFHMSTEGFSQPVLHLAAVNEGAAEKILVDYSINDDSDSWITGGLNKTEINLGSTYQLFEINLSNAKGVKNNPDLKVRFRFDGPDMFQDNGDRVTFNNISLMGKSLETFTVLSQSAANGIIEPEGNIPAWEGSSREFTITPDPLYRIENVWLDGVNVIDELIFKNDSVAFISLSNIQSDHHVYVEFFEPEEEPDKVTPQLILYPNPASDRVTINTLHNMHSIDVAGITGQIMMSMRVPETRLHEIDIASLKSGIYIVAVKTDSGVFTQKLLVLK